MGSGASSDNKSRKRVTFADTDEAEYSHPNYYRDQTEDDSSETQRQTSTLSLGHKILVIARQRKAVDDWYQRANGRKQEKSPEDVRKEFEDDVTWKERLRQRVIKQQERDDRRRALQPAPQQIVIKYIPGGTSTGRENSRSDAPSIDLENYMEYEQHYDENSSFTDSQLQNYARNFRDYSKGHNAPPTPTQNSGSNKDGISVSETSGYSLPQLSLPSEGDSKTPPSVPPRNQTQTNDSIETKNNTPNNKPRTIDKPRAPTPVEMKEVEPIPPIPHNERYLNEGTGTVDKPRVPTPVEAKIENEAEQPLNVPHKERYLNEDIKPKDEEFNIPHKEYYLNEDFESENPELKVPHNEMYVNESMLTARNLDDGQDDKGESGVIQTSDIDENEQSIMVNRDMVPRGIEHEGYINENYHETEGIKNNENFFITQHGDSTMPAQERNKQKKKQQVTFKGDDSGMTKYKNSKKGHSNLSQKKKSQIKPKQFSTKQSVYHESVPQIMREKAELEFTKKEKSEKTEKNEVELNNKEKSEEKPKSGKMQPISTKYRNYRHSYKRK